MMENGTIMNPLRYGKRNLSEPIPKFVLQKPIRGSKKIEQKLAILKKYLTDKWHINLDELRAEIRSRYPYVVGSDFEGNPVPRKDFSVLTDD